MVLKFEGNKVDKVFSPQLNNMAYASKNSVLSGCGVTESSPTGLSVDVASGRIFFGNDEIDVSASTNLSISSNSSSYDRRDVIVVDSTGTVSVVQGTAGTLSVPPDYDPDNYISLAIVYVNAGASSISNSDIEDVRITHTGGVFGGSGSFARRVKSFTSQTSVNVQHNLGDDEPIVQVYDNSRQIIPNKDITSIVVNSVNDITVTFSGSTSGYIVVYGGIGINNGYYSKDFSSTTTVNVPHNLGNQNVIVQAVNTSGVNIPDADITSITRDDDDNVTVVFGSSKSGTIIVTGGVSSSGLPTASNGDIVYYNGSSWVALSAGTSGQLLKTNGAGSAPEWSDVDGGTF